MAYLLDGLVLLLFGGMVYLGYRQGVIRTLSGVISFVVALVLTVALTGPVTDLVYDNAVQPTVVEQLDAHIGEDSPAAEKVDAALERMPAYIRNRLVASGLKNGADLLAWVGDADPDTSSVDWVANKGIRPVIYPVVEALCSLALFVVLSLLLNLLLRLADKLAEIPTIKKVNKSLGLVAGAIQGMLWVLLVVGVLELISLGEMVPLFDEELLNSTLLIKWLRGVNPLGGVIREYFSFL